jgi:hypothetical protein
MKVVKKKLANKDFDFLYDEKKGGLYFNENGADKGFGDGGIIAILKGAPDLTSTNLEFSEMSKVRTYNGVKSGQVVDSDNSQGQWVLGDQFLVFTINFPEVKTANSLRAQYSTKTIFKGEFAYKGGTLDLQKSLLSESGNFFYQRNKDGSTKESGYGYKFKNGTPFPVGDADNAASEVSFSYSNDASTTWSGNKLGSFPISSKRSVIKNSSFGKLIPKQWGEDPFSLNEGKVRSNNENQDLILDSPSKFNKKSADKITNFSPSTDTLEINTENFGIDSSATFAIGKNMKAVKKKFAKQDFDFLYDQKKGGLYFNKNGADKGFGDGGIIAILKGAPDLTIQNIDFL